MIVGLLPDAASAETLLNNLAEADFDLAQVSVVARNLAPGRLAPEGGPVQGATPDTLYDRLTRAGLPAPDAKRCADAVAQGKVLVALTVPAAARAAAKEMLRDHSAEFILE